MAHGYGYGNARLRALRSRLLSQADYDDLLAQATVEDLITRLAETPYKGDIEAALVRFGGPRRVSEALSANLTRTLRRIRTFYEGEPRALVDLLLRRWDRHNLLTVLRGQSREIPSEDVLMTVVPVGDADQVALREMARQPGLRAAMDLMTSWRLPYAGALREVRAATGSSPDLDQLELALSRAHYAAIRQALANGNGNRATVLAYIESEIDLINVRTVLRLARHPELMPLIRQRYHTTTIEPLLIEPAGQLSGPRLAQVAMNAGGPEAVVRELQTSRYGEALQIGWQRWQAGEGGLAVMERELERWQLRSSAAMFLRDPLGIGIVIGYLDYKETEIANLRLIAQAVALDMQRDEVRRDLIIL